MANEMWLIIFLFLYHIFNNISVSDKKASQRRERFITFQFSKINRKYSGIITKITSNQRIRQLALAIIIYESFNRPKMFRIIEYITHLFVKKKHTLGIMQVASDRFISDSESVKLGTIKLVEDYRILLIEYPTDNMDYYREEHKDRAYQARLIEKFNPDLIYSHEILELANKINTSYFQGGSTSLFKDEGQ